MPGPTISTGDDKDDMKDSKMATDFPIDDTPTPTKILRMADELFPSFSSDLKENPFDAHFRKAAEAVKSGMLKGVELTVEVKSRYRYSYLLPTCCNTNLDEVLRVQDQIG